ncbi:L-histidine Nalpha-methyltransferase [Streptoalloteichus tenebrarius]|uniref:Histidine N-alpha-methyltransferase n=1 Tax=Streptoalloteichus tenebrarius (strain ATCC 17920 / DSM 40477 / JCM 4838 / CBS 697.72 / NBRC 16177 / NCIMB 11028 / NRRL B-12390 / A12253. 1 / ISP 5477) TaxID=1933 RepID=A0ABT1HQT9_STRSD|nr:L-histidine N(alpha)-methyltransferase [Streptoalloteichus tenebrarius]MCP2257881.1 L-histidine Nalpha-methyltransferase [Streptoalloteichus tenebrarius]
MSEPVLEVRFTERDAATALRSDVRAGLTDAPKWLSPKWFYDARGSALFDRITALPEYYPTRAERAVLAARAGDIAALTAAQELVELGSGSSEKTRLLLDALVGHGSLRRFVPLDVSEPALRAATAAVAADYPGLVVHGIVADFTERLAIPSDGARRLVAFLGGTIGNLLPEERAWFLKELRHVLRHGEFLLLGTDLVKDPAALVRAYDDAEGVTAEFNRNVLLVLNRELGATFDVTGFDHVALWNAEQEWIEMRLRALRDMRVHVAALDMVVSFGAGEDLRTEVSAKFRPERVADELAAAGFALRRLWTDDHVRFGLSLAEAV